MYPCLSPLTQTKDNSEDEGGGGCERAIKRFVVTTARVLNEALRQSQTAPRSRNKHLRGRLDEHLILSDKAAGVTGGAHRATLSMSHHYARGEVQAEGDLGGGYQTALSGRTEHKCGSAKLDFGRSPTRSGRGWFSARSALSRRVGAGHAARSHRSLRKCSRTNCE